MSAIGTGFDANGWTTFTPSADTRVVYVSSSAGNDSNSGLSQSAPVATISQGLSLIRDGSADQLLLRAGDTWVNQDFGFLEFSGRSASEPILISSYGTGARPLIETPANSGEPAIGSLTPGHGSNIAVVGLEFYAYTRDPNNSHFAGTRDETGMEFDAAVHNVLIEDSKFSFFSVNVFQGDGSDNIDLRRNVITDNYSVTGHSQGFYAFGTTNLTLEQNLLDHNGWNSQIAGAEPTIFNHNIYIHEGNGPATLIGNISANASSHGAQVRPSGTVTDNLFVHDPIALLVGFQGGTSGGTVTNNVVTESSDINPTEPRGWGIDIGGDTLSVNNNIVTHDASADAAFAIVLESGTGGDVVQNNIVYAWDNPSIINEGASSNIISQNAVNQTGYLDPNRTVETYMASIGGTASLDAYLAAARDQSKANWNTAYTADAVNTYIEAGFNKSATPPPPPPPDEFVLIVGTSKNNTLTGTSEVDNIFGQGGDDVLIGLGSTDQLTGGPGNDRFRYTALSDSAPGAADTIMDFVHGSDRVDLRPIDANTSLVNNQAFVWGGQSDAVVSHGITWHEANGETIVLGNVTGGTQVDFELHMAGTGLHLASTDFLL